MSNDASKYDEVVNQLCDDDELWGGFLFLRPAREQRFGAARVLLLASLFSWFFGLCANAIFAAYRFVTHIPTVPVYLAPLFLTAATFVLGWWFVAGAWNRRAEQLTRRLEWVKVSRRPGE